MVWAVSTEWLRRGTGGGWRLAAGHARGNPVRVLKGDRYCRFDLARTLAFHGEKRAQVTMWLQPNADASRYGTVELDAGTGEVTAFLEKGRSGEGLISCGV